MSDGLPLADNKGNDHEELAVILVTGATGKVGRQVVSQLKERGKSVRAVVRDPNSAALPTGVDVVRADLTDPASLEPHLTDVESVFFLWPFISPRTVAELAPRVVEVIARHIPRIVYLSAQPAAEQPDSFWTVVEHLIEKSGMEWTFLRPVGFAANTLMWTDQIRAGDVVRWPYGSAARSLIHERDIAAVAVRALTEDGHAGSSYVLTGPAAVTQADQVRAIGAALGRPLRWEELSREAAKKELTDAFGDSTFAETALITWAGFMSQPELVTSAVREITGTPARTFERWVADHVDDFR